MSLNKRFTACIITMFILLSIFIVPLTEEVKAEEEYSDIESILEIISIGKQLIDFDDVMDPHPFRFIGVWNSNTSMTINGDITFDLYFSSTIMTQLEFLNLQDSVEISVHYRDESGLVKKVENANTTMTLKPDPSTSFIQSYQITINDIYLELEENDDLIFVIEIKQSEKPLNDFVEKRFDTKIKRRVEKISNLMKKSGDPDLVMIADMVDDVMNNLSKLNIGGDEFGALVNTLVSSAFYYGSNSYPSMAEFSTEEGDIVSLYFHNEIDYSFETNFMDLGYIKVVNGTKPTVNANYAYPPIAVNIDKLDITEINEEEWLSWLAVWALYVFEEPEDFENRVTYYIHSGGVMDTDDPEGFDSEREKLSEAATVWTGESFERNKILKNITADLYIYHPKLLTFKKTKIVVSLKQGNETIATSEKELDRTTLLEKLKRNAEVPTRFNFEDLSENEEIWYDEDLRFEVKVGSAPFSLFKKPIISYDSSEHPSKLIIDYSETDNLKTEDIEDKEIYAGEKIEYKINVSSKYSDNLELSIDKIDGFGDWSYSVSPENINIAEGETEEITIYVESEATDADAYDDKDFIQLGLNISGNTGFIRSTTNVSVSEAAVEHDIEIDTAENIEIKHGSEGTIHFEVINKNKGYMADRYTINITSEHGWKLKYTEYIAEYLEVSEGSEMNATLSVPWYTDIKNEEITFEVTSFESEKYDTFTKTITVNVTIGEPNILDNIYQLFENAAKTIGLDSFSEQYAGWILILLIAILVLLLSLVTIILKITKYAKLTCLQRIKEINTDETATYDITIKNPYKKLLTYEIKTETEEDNIRRWDVSTDTTQIMIEPGKEKNIKLSIKPKDYIRKEDWIEVKVIVKPVDKNKKTELSTVTSVKNTKVDVKISGVFHWPRVFKKDDRVETSFKLFNRGNVSAEKISVVLYINGEEKNKVEDITIPRGGHADINMPWIAVKGKNEVYIVVK